MAEKMITYGKNGSLVSRRKAAAFLKGSVKNGGPSQILIKKTRKNFKNY